MSMKKVFNQIKPRSGSNSAAGSDTEGSPHPSTTSTNHHQPSRISTALSSLSAESRHSLDGGKGRHSTDSPRHSLPFSPHRASKDHGDSKHRSGTPLGMLRRKFKSNSDDSHSSTEDLPLNREADPLSRNQLRKHEKQAAREAHKKEADERREADQKRQGGYGKEGSREEETPEQKAMYGVLPVNAYAGEDKQTGRVNIMTLKPEQVGETVTFRARIHNLRKQSAHLMFIELRQQTRPPSRVFWPSTMTSRLPALPLFCGAPPRGDHRTA